MANRWSKLDLRSRGLALKWTNMAILGRVQVLVLSMVLNQVHGLVLGLGTIDRMKLKEDDLVEGTPVPFSHVFGIWWPAYFLPFDPVFEKFEDVLHYQIGETNFCDNKI